MVEILTLLVNDSALGFPMYTRTKATFFSSILVHRDCLGCKKGNGGERALILEWTSFRGGQDPSSA